MWFNFILLKKKENNPSFPSKVRIEGLITCTKIVKWLAKEGCNMATTTFPEWQETNWIRHLKLKGSHNEGKEWSGLVVTTVKLSDTVRPLENVDLYFTGYSSGLHISPPSSKEASLSPACPQLSPSQTTCKGKRECKRSCQSIGWGISSFGLHQ